MLLCYQTLVGIVNPQKENGQILVAAGTAVWPFATSLWVSVETSGIFSYPWERGKEGSGEGGREKEGWR